MRGGVTTELSTMMADYGADDAAPGADGTDTDLGMIQCRSLRIGKLISLNFYTE